VLCSVSMFHCSELRLSIPIGTELVCVVLWTSACEATQHCCFSIKGFFSLWWWTLRWKCVDISLYCIQISAYSTFI
jgi:hypothetical protein